MSTQLIFLGAPGSGKGTQASRLVKEKGLKHISTGDLLREEIKRGSELGKRVARIMEAGELVSDEIVLELLKSNCNLEASSYIFDGFPRNISQAQSLDSKVLDGSTYKAVYFKLDPKILVGRLTNRRTCGNCNAIYNLLTSPPKNPGICDICGSQNLVQRKDDFEDVIRNRLDVYLQNISPVLNYYRSKGTLVEVDASKQMDEVYSELVRAIN